MTQPYGHNLPTFSIPSAPGTPTPGPATPQFINQSYLSTPSQRASKAPTGAKRGRKPKNPTATASSSAANSPRIQQSSFNFQPTASSSSNGADAPGTQYTGNHYQPQANWTLPGGPNSPAPGAAQPSNGSGGAGSSSGLGLMVPSGSGGRGSSEVPGSSPNLDSQMMPPPPLHSSNLIHGPPPPILQGRPAHEDENEGDDDMLPAMADDDYSAQLSFQTQSKDNLKVLMDNFSPEQYDRFEAYRRHALPKQAVRKVIQQTVGQQVSQPVAQIIAGFSKVFVGEMVEKARSVQARRGETGPLSPDHLREAYRMYQEETGRVGAARPLRSKRLFVR